MHLLRNEFCRPPILVFPLEPLSSLVSLPEFRSATRVLKQQLQSPTQAADLPRSQYRVTKFKERSCRSLEVPVADGIMGQNKHREFYQGALRSLAFEGRDGTPIVELCGDDEM